MKFILNILSFFEQNILYKFNLIKIAFTSNWINTRIFTYSVNKGCYYISYNIFQNVLIFY